MPVLVSVPDDIANSAAQLSKDSGIPAESLLIQALRAHFPPIPEDLQEEFDAFERASDEDFVRFEQSLEDQ